MIGSFFTKAKNKHEKTFAAAGKAINEKLRLYAKVGTALIDAREKGAILSQQSKPIPIFRFGLTSGISAFLIIYNDSASQWTPFVFYPVSREWIRFGPAPARFDPPPLLERCRIKPGAHGLVISRVDAR